MLEILPVLVIMLCMHIYRTRQNNKGKYLYNVLNIGTNNEDKSKGGVNIPLGITFVLFTVAFSIIFSIILGRLMMLIFGINLFDINILFNFIISTVFIISLILFAKIIDMIIKSKDVKNN